MLNVLYGNTFRNQFRKMKFWSITMLLYSISFRWQRILSDFNSYASKRFKLNLGGRMSEEKNGSSNSIYLHLCDLFSKVQNIQICWYPLYDKTVLSIML